MPVFDQCRTSFLKQNWRIGFQLERDHKSIGYPVFDQRSQYFGNHFKMKSQRSAVRLNFVFCHVFRWNVKIGHGGGQIQHGIGAQGFQDTGHLPQVEQIVWKCGEGDGEQVLPQRLICRAHFSQLTSDRIGHWGSKRRLIWEERKLHKQSIKEYVWGANILPVKEWSDWNEMDEIKVDKSRCRVNGSSDLSRCKNMTAYPFLRKYLSLSWLTSSSNKLNVILINCYVLSWSGSSSTGRKIVHKSDRVMFDWHRRTARLWFGRTRKKIQVSLEKENSNWLPYLPLSTRLGDLDELDKNCRFDRTHHSSWTVSEEYKKIAQFQPKIVRHRFRDSWLTMFNEAQLKDDI